MIHKIIKNEVEDYGDFNLFYIKNKEDLAEFIKSHYQGRYSETNKIPIDKWFIYRVDDTGDRTWDEIILLEDFKSDILKNILDNSILYKQLQELEN